MVCEGMNKHKLIRLAVAAPITGGALVILMMFVTQPGTGPGTRFNWSFAIVTVVGLLLLGLQTWANYYRQWYDPTLGLKYQDLFCAPELLDSRKRACRHFLKHKEWPIEIEDMLDVFDDLGFYVQTIQVSRDVLHQYFYWWIRGYVGMAEGYIKAKQKGDSTKKEPADPTRWEHCKLLLEEVSTVEAARLKAVKAADRSVDWSEDQKMRFLKEEAQLENKPGEVEAPSNGNPTN